MEAYVNHSSTVLQYTNEIPIVGEMGYSEFFDVKDRLNPNRKVKPIDIHVAIAEHPTHKLFIDSVRELGRFLYFQFPLITWNSQSLTKLIFETQSVFEQIIHPIISTTRGSMAKKYRSYLADSPPFGEVNTMLGSLLRYLHGLSRDLPLREKLFTNLVPIVHAWHRVHQILGISSPVSQDDYLEFISEAQLYHPMYVTGPESEWSIQVAPHPYARLVLPITTPKAAENFPLIVHDILEVSIDTDTVSSLIPTLVEKIKEHNVDQVRAVLYMVKRHPQISKSDQELFCNLSKPLWSDAFDAFKKQFVHELPRIHLLDLLELSKICGVTYLPIETRVTQWLPLYLGRSRKWVPKGVRPKNELANTRQRILYILTYLSSVSLQFHRSFIRFRDTETTNDMEGDHIRYVANLTQAVVKIKLGQSFDRMSIEDIIKSDGKLFFSRKSFLLGLGTVIGHGILFGDPGRHLYNAIVSKEIPTLNMNSTTVYAGLCLVIDCLVLESMFTADETATFLDLIHNHTNSFIY